MDMTRGRIFAAEFIGTFILVFGGVGTAVLAGPAVGPLGVALAFGLSLMVAGHAVGPVSGCHVNPAVTVAMALMRRVDVAIVWLYWAAQLAGATFAGLGIWLIARGQLGGFVSTPESMSANMWGIENGMFSFGAMMIAEVILTAVLVLVILSTDNEGFPVGATEMVIGGAYAVLHLVALSIDGASFNPARSFGSAVFAGGDAVTQLWAFFVFPIIGAVLGVLAWLMIDEDRLEDTLLADTPLDEIRDTVDDLL